MSTPPGQAATPRPPGAQDARSDTLLPDDGQSGDGRFDVAEEVSLDQQSDTARKVGEAPAGNAGDAIAESLRGNKPEPEGTPPK